MVAKNELIYDKLEKTMKEETLSKRIIAHLNQKIERL